MNLILLNARHFYLRYLYDHISHTQSVLLTYILNLFLFPFPPLNCGFIFCPYLVAHTSLSRVPFSCGLNELNFLGRKGGGPRKNPELKYLWCSLRQKRDEP